MTTQDLADIHHRMEKQLEEQGVRIDGIYYCPQGREDDCECRKPKAGLLFRAAAGHHLDLPNVVFIGDSEYDVAAGQAAGCRVERVAEGNDLFATVNNFLNI